MKKDSKSDYDKDDSSVDDVEEYKERALNLVLTDKKESLEFYDQKFKMFNYYDRLYQKGAAKSNVPYGRANLELPLAFQQIEPFVCQMTETMVGESPILAYEGRNLDDEPVAEDITAFTQYQLDQGGFLMAWQPWIRNLGKYGTACMKVVWEHEVLEIEEEEETPIIELQLDPITGQMVPTENGTETKITTREIPKKDGPGFYNISLFDIFIPRGAVSCDVQKMDFIIHRTYRTLHELLDNPNYKDAHKRIKELIDDEDTAESSSDYTGSSSAGADQYKQNSENQKNPSKGTTKYKGKIEILERWGNFTKEKGGKSIPYIITVAAIEDEELVLRCEKNPLKFKFKPFIIGNDYPIEGEAYGYGELHHIKGLIEESTALRNARLDTANLSLNRTWLVERQAGVNLRELYTAPNKIIPTNDINGIKALDMGQVTPSSVNELARIDFDIQNTTEIINPRQDVSNVGAAFGGTATGVNFLSAKTNLRLLNKARTIEETFFKPLAYMLNWYNRDLITDEVYYRVAGDSKENPYRTVGPESFLIDVDYKPSSNPHKKSNDEKKADLGYLLQTLAQIEGVAPGMNNWPEILKQVYKVAGFPHPEKYVTDPQTVVLQTPDGQVVDKRGQPVQIVPVDEQGQPLPPPEPGTPTENGPVL